MLNDGEYLDDFSVTWQNQLGRTFSTPAFWISIIGLFIIIAFCIAILVLVIMTYNKIKK